MRRIRRKKKVAPTVREMRSTLLLVRSKLREALELSKSKEGL